MDSLTRDVEKIFNASREMGYQEIYDEKTMAFKVLKRLFDITASSFALLILSPVFLLTAIAILLEDGGPVFFIQPRAGKGMKPFRMYKFRSMFKNADQLFAQLQEKNEQSGHAFKIKDDPRITKVGKIIRKYSIDELPQLINILKGDMSIVGPRPERVEHVELYTRQIPEFRYRMKVKGGLTGYAQVYGKYNTSAYDKLKLDLMYIQNYSLMMDVGDRAKKGFLLRLEI